MFFFVLGTCNFCELLYVNYFKHLLKSWLQNGWRYNAFNLTLTFDVNLFEYEVTVLWPSIIEKNQKYLYIYISDWSDTIGIISNIQKKDMIENTAIGQIMCMLLDCKSRTN